MRKDQRIILLPLKVASPELRVMSSKENTIQNRRGRHKCLPVDRLIREEGRCTRAAVQQILPSKDEIITPLM